MHHDPHTALRGFDSYRIRLGDELRGHRATMGKSLLDVQRDLRIKASYIDAIENCDASVIPNKGFVSGYVRAYARYLSLDAEEVYARFCEESGFAGQGAAPARPGPAGRRGGHDPALARSHFATPVGRARRVGFGISPSDLMSVVVLAALAGGLGWGGLAVIRDIQRVEFAPLETPPGTLAAAPDAVAAPALALQAAPATSWHDEGPARDAALASLFSPPDTPPPSIALSDGPIAAIDPAHSGLFADAPPPMRDAPVLTADMREAGPRPEPRLDDLPQLPGTVGAAPGAPVMTASLDAAGLPGPLPAQAAALGAPASDGLWLVFTEPCWVQVKSADGATLVERIFDVGERWQVPEGALRPRLRAGNGQGVLVEAGGRRFGPLGRSGEVLRSVTLTPEAIAEAYAPSAIPQTAARLAD